MYSFVNTTGCYFPGSGCHSTTATSTIGVVIELDSNGTTPTTHYKGGMTYTVKITGTNTGATLAKYGFQLSAIVGTASAATVTDAGTFATTGLPTSTRISPPQSGATYLTVAEQSTAITLSGGTFSKSFSWTAPVTGTGAIAFFGAANFVNGNGNADAGDLWNTTSAVINEWSTVSVPNVVNNIDVNIFPNPIANSMNVAIGNVAAGNYEVCVFDLNGKMVACTSFVATGSAQNASINTANLVAGVYNVVISNGTDKKVVSVVKQ